MHESFRMAASRAPVSIVLTLLLGLPPGPPLAAQTRAPAPARLSIVVVEGEGAVNSIQRRAARGPVVRVEDEKRRPLAGATVLFMLPDSGPSGTFGGGRRTLLVRTDSAGLAAVKGFRANDSLGRFEIQVQASLRGVTTKASITQVNAAPPADRSKGGSRRILLVLAAAGAAAAAGAVVAARGKPSDAATLSISAGTPAVGGPQ